MAEKALKKMFYAGNKNAQKPPPVMGGGLFMA
jgi:hypothetical protein